VNIIKFVSFSGRIKSFSIYQDRPVGRPPDLLNYKQTPTFKSGTLTVRQNQINSKSHFRVALKRVLLIFPRQRERFGVFRRN
jgi:hypothetical protein